ncbi:ATP-binding protein [Streptomyces sp. NPDC006487]|uniref:ATP-binding protein n=1 Tax=Streptomyces sp. NPDC006487 TaxID=3364748 RepID=UPI0036B6959D
MYSSAPLPQRPIVRSAPRWDLSACPKSPGAARRQVAATLTLWNLEGLVDDALLIVSELVTNAATHGLGPIWHSLTTVAVDEATMSVHMVVGDSGPGWRSPEPVRATSLDTSGRGLGIVDALATFWGTVQTAVGHEVWADLLTPVTVAREPQRLAALPERLVTDGAGCACADIPGGGVRRTSQRVRRAGPTDRR